MTSDELEMDAMLHAGTLWSIMEDYKAGHTDEALLRIANLSRNELRMMLTIAMHKMAYGEIDERVR